MRYGLQSRKFGSIEAKSDDFEEKKSAREQRIKNYKLMVYEDSDATLLRLFECFMESAPQLILQVRNNTLLQTFIFCPKIKLDFFYIISQKILKLKG